MPIEELNKVVQLSDQLLDRGLGDGITVSDDVLGVHFVVLTNCFIYSSRRQDLNSGSASSCCRATFRPATSFGQAED